MHNNVLFPCVLLHCQYLHKMMFLSFVFLRFFNAHWIYWCSSWSCMLSCTPTLSTCAQKLNCRCCICNLNYCLRKLYLLIIHLPFCKCWRWWWMQQQPYNQWLNIQHSFLSSSQLFFYFCFFQLFNFILLLCLCSLLCASFSLLFVVVFQLHFLHSYCCEL